MSKPIKLTQAPAGQLTEEQAEQQLNQLLNEIRMLETYYNETVNRIQVASAGLTDARMAIQALEGLDQNPNGELLVPIGGGLLMPTKNSDAKKIILSVGAGVALEKDFNSAKVFLQAHEKDLEKALNSLEQQRREIGTRLDAGKSILQRLTTNG